jgi:hypothetical protein
MTIQKDSKKSPMYQFWFLITGIKWAASKVLFLNFSFTRPLHIVHHPKQLKLRRLPKIIGFIWGRSVSLWLKYKAEKGRTLGKGIWDEVRYYCEHPGEHIGNLENVMENSMGTQGYNIPPSHPPQKEKKPSLVYVESYHWLLAYSIPRHGCHHFFCLS